MKYLDEGNPFESIDDKKKQHNCVICEAIFVQRSQLFQHALEKHNVQSEKYKQLRIKYKKKIRRRKKYICTFCNQKCESAEEFKSHLSTFHEGSKPYKCSECDADFFLESGLKKHFAMRHKNTEKKFKCSTCFMMFRLKTELAKHNVDDHDMKKPYKCPQCENRFAFKHHLNRYVKILNLDGNFQPNMNFLTQVATLQRLLVDLENVWLCAISIDYFMH